MPCGNRDPGSPPRASELDVDHAEARIVGDMRGGDLSRTVTAVIQHHNDLGFHGAVLPFQRISGRLQREQGFADVLLLVVRRHHHSHALDIASARHGYPVLPGARRTSSMKSFSR